MLWPGILARVLLISFFCNGRHCLDYEAKTDEPVCDNPRRESLIDSRPVKHSPNSIRGGEQALDANELDLAELDADERDICLFLASYRGQLVSPMEIARRAGGKKRFREEPKWAVRVLVRLVEKRVIETDAKGHYRSRLPGDKELANGQQEPEARSCPRRKILFVDDYADSREVVAQVLQDAGGDVSIAKDASDALVQLYDTKLDLIILALDLSGDGGLKLMKFLGRNQRDVPVILYTGLSHTDDTVLSMLMQGAHQYVRKGQLEKLRRAVRTALDEVQQ